MEIEWIVNELSRFPKVQKNEDALPSFSVILIKYNFIALIYLLLKFCLNGSKHAKLENFRGVKIINVNNLI